MAEPINFSELNRPLGNEIGLWEAALASFEGAILIFDPVENRILQFNDCLVGLTGVAGYKLIKMSVSGLFYNQLPHLISVTQACIDQGKAWTNHLSIGMAEENLKPVELYASRISNRDDQLILFVMFDLRRERQRRSRAEMELSYKSNLPQWNRVEQVFREIERGNQLILNAAGEGVYGVDANGITTFLNPAGERMLGWKSEELVGRVAHNVFHYSHADGTPYQLNCCPIYAAFRDGVVHHVDNEVFWRKDGSSFPVEYTSTPIQDNGRLLGAVVVFSDISKRREAENKLKQALTEVESLKKRLELENAYLQDELRSEHHHKHIVGSSDCMKQIMRQIDLVAPTDANVLISGESGTGKEVIARAIHESSDRRDRPLIKVNCAAIPKELFESEFFGHAKGAFTGAVGERVGRFELANGGTIFLDEVGELPPDQQAKLLRVLQEQQFERVGDTKTRNVDVRVITATNKDLKAAVAAKEFREDLFFRLNVFPIDVPPLREHKEDIPELALHFVEKACKRLNKPNAVVSKAAVEKLTMYAWPGNVRELENIIERAVIVSPGSKLHVDLQVSSESTSPNLGTEKKKLGLLTDEDRKNVEKKSLIEALRESRGRVSGPGGAAELIGVRPTTLYSRLKKHGIDARAFK